MRHSSFESIVENGGRIHFIGIGGVSMSCIAETLFIKGAGITGSDMQEGPAVTRLRALGIPVEVGHRAENVQGTDLVVYTAAISGDNPELAAARALGIPVMERAEALGHQMRGHGEVLCVAGTHGKSTTTAMAASISLQNGDDPTVMIGADFAPIGGGYRMGNGSLFIAEACEYSDAFLKFCPTVALILNIDNDHLDYFGSIEKIRESFRTFAELLPENGRLVVNCEDENTMKAVSGLERKTVTFGIDSGDIHTKNLELAGGLGRFTLVKNGEDIAEISLSVYGEHNVFDALGAAAAMLELGASPRSVAEGLAKFTGTGRRMEERGHCNGADVMDDYAHHHSEMRAVLLAVKKMGYKRIVCAFQPHTFSRLESQMEDFARVLGLADLVLVTDVYAAREKPIDGVDSKKLASKIEGAEYTPTLEDTAKQLRELAQKGDLIITMGAGSINRVAGMITAP